MKMTETITTDHPLTGDEKDMLRTLAGLIVPASETHNIPGADDSTIFASILLAAKQNSVEIRSSLVFANTKSQELTPNADYSDQLTRALEGRREIASLVSLILQCYYQDDRVMQSLGMEPRPPFPEGYEIEQGDWAMLEPVQARGKIWRDT